MGADLTVTAGPLDISIILATSGRSELLKGTIDSVNRLHLDGISAELIVVDNGSQDSTRSLLASMNTVLPLVVLHEPVAGKNRALNRAVRHARGHLLLFTDDDVILGQAWAAELLNASRRWPDDVIFAGPVSPVFTQDAPRWMRDPKFCYSGMAFARYEFDCPEGAVDYPPFGPNLALRASVFQTQRYNEQVGPDGTDTYVMGSESEFLQRLRAKGARFIYVPGAPVQHRIRAEQVAVDWLVRRAYRSGRAAAQALREYAGPRLYGVPRYLWRLAAIDALAVVRALVAGPEARCVARMNLARTRAIISEARQQHLQVSGRLGRSVT